jgi:hypothetical protein
MASVQVLGPEFYQRNSINQRKGLPIVSHPSLLHDRVPGTPAGKKYLTRALGALGLVAAATFFPATSAFANGPYRPNTNGLPTSDGVIPVYHAGNITSCPSGTTEIINTSDIGPGNQNVSYSQGGVTFTTTITNGTYLAFTQSGLDSFTIYVKGGPAYDEYDYTGPFAGTTSDSGLHMPVNNGGNISTISHYLVCATSFVVFPTVKVGYADDEHGGTVHNPGAPWPPAFGSTGVNFAGCPVGAATQDYITICPTATGSPGHGGTYNGDFDSGAIDLHNSTAAAMTVQSVTVTVNGGTGSACTFNIWPNDMVVPANGDLVLAQTAQTAAPCGDGPSVYNFDSSDTQITACTLDAIAPTITVTLPGGASKTYTDSSLALTSGGDDPGSCPVGTSTDETVSWTATT